MTIRKIKHTIQYSTKEVWLYSRTPNHQCRIHAWEASDWISFIIWTYVVQWSIVESSLFPPMHLALEPVGHDGTDEPVNQCNYEGQHYALVVCVPDLNSSQGKFKYNDFTV